MKTLILMALYPRVCWRAMKRRRAHMDALEKGISRTRKRAKALMEEDKIGDARIASSVVQIQRENLSLDYERGFVYYIELEMR